MTNLSNETRQKIIKLLEGCEFRKLCDIYFDDNFLWIIKGTSLLSGTYKDKEVFFEKVINRLSKLLRPGWKMHILGVYADDDALIS